MGYCATPSNPHGHYIVHSFIGCIAKNQKITSKAELGRFYLIIITEDKTQYLLKDQRGA